MKCGLVVPILYLWIGSVVSYSDDLLRLLRSRKELYRPQREVLLEEIDLPSRNYFRNREYNLRDYNQLRNLDESYKSALSLLAFENALKSSSYRYSGKEVLQIEEPRRKVIDIEVEERSPRLSVAKEKPEFIQDSIPSHHSLSAKEALNLLRKRNLDIYVLQNQNSRDKIENKEIEIVLPASPNYRQRTLLYDAPKLQDGNQNLLDLENALKLLRRRNLHEEIENPENAVEFDILERHPSKFPHPSKSSLERLDLRNLMNQLEDVTDSLNDPKVKVTELIEKKHTKNPFSRLSSNDARLKVIDAVPSPNANLHGEFSVYKTLFEDPLEKLTDFATEQHSRKPSLRLSRSSNENLETTQALIEAVKILDEYRKLEITEDKQPSISIFDLIKVRKQRSKNPLRTRLSDFYNSDARFREAELITAARPSVFLKKRNLPSRFVFSERELRKPYEIDLVTVEELDESHKKLVTKDLSKIPNPTSPISEHKPSIKDITLIDRSTAVTNPETMSYDNSIKKSALLASNAADKAISASATAKVASLDAVSLADSATKLLKSALLSFPAYSNAESTVAVESKFPLTRKLESNTNSDKLVLSIKEGFATPSFLKDSHEKTKITNHLSQDNSINKIISQSIEAAVSGALKSIFSSSHLNLKDLPDPDLSHSKEVHADAVPSSVRITNAKLSNLHHPTHNHNNKNPHVSHKHNKINNKLRVPQYLPLYHKPITTPKKGAHISKLTTNQREPNKTNVIYKSPKNLLTSSQNNNKHSDYIAYKAPKNILSSLQNDDEKDDSLDDETQNDADVSTLFFSLPVSTKTSAVSDKSSIIYDANSKDKNHRRKPTKLEIDTALASLVLAQALKNSNDKNKKTEASSATAASSTSSTTVSDTNSASSSSSSSAASNTDSSSNAATASATSASDTQSKQKYHPSQNHHRKLSKLEIDTALASLALAKAQAKAETNSESKTFDATSINTHQKQKGATKTLPLLKQSQQNLKSDDDYSDGSGSEKARSTTSSVSVTKTENRQSTATGSAVAIGSTNEESKITSSASAKSGNENSQTGITNSSGSTAGSSVEESNLSTNSASVASSSVTSSNSESDISQTSSSATASTTSSATATASAASVVTSSKSESDLSTLNSAFTSDSSSNSASESSFNDMNQSKGDTSAPIITIIDNGSKHEDDVEIVVGTNVKEEDNKK